MKVAGLVSFLKPPFENSVTFIRAFHIIHVLLQMSNYPETEQNLTEVHNPVGNDHEEKIAVLVCCTSHCGLFQGCPANRV